MNKTMDCTRIYLGLMIILLTGCASTAPDYDEKLSVDDAAASVTFKQIFYEKLDYGEERREFFTLNLLHEFAEGKSVYRAFELPEFIKPYQITIRSRVFKSKGQQQVFLPIVDKLSIAFDLLEKYEVSKNDAQTALAQSTPIEFQLLIGPKDRFLIIHSRSGLFSRPVDEKRGHAIVFARAGNLDIILPLRGDK